MALLTPGDRPGVWQTVGDLVRRVMRLEAVPPCCDSLCASGVHTLASTILANPCVSSFWPMDDVGPGAIDLGPFGASLIENPTGFAGGQPVGSQGTFSFLYGQAGPFADAPDATSIHFDGNPFGASPRGTCLYFDYPGANPTSGSYTILGWAKIDDTDSRTFVTFWGGGIADTAITSFSDDLAFFVHSSTDTATVTAAGAAVIDTWFFLAATFDSGTGVIEFFIDGVSQGTDTLTGANDAGAGYLRFGTAGNSLATDPGNYLKGNLSQWALFGCVLTDAEILDLAALGGSPAPGGGKVLTSTGVGECAFEFPTIAVDDPTGRYNTLNIGPGLEGTDEGDGSVTFAVDVDNSTIEVASPIRVKDLGITEAKLGFSDITTANVSTAKHGLAPKSPNDASVFLDGTGAYSTPASDPASDTEVWMPLTSTVSGDDVLVFDADHSLIPTLIPF